MDNSEDPRYPQAEIEGFTLGMFVSYDDCGDAWVQAPDGGIATLIWETGSPATSPRRSHPTPTADGAPTPSSSTCP